MASVWIARRDTTKSGPRFRVLCRDGRQGPMTYCGSFKSESAARLRKEAVEQQLALGGPISVAKSVCVTEYFGPRVGKSWRLKYTDDGGRQVMVTLGTAKDGYTREMADAAAARFVLDQRANPLGPLLRLAKALVDRQERAFGEALPHLYVALTQIDQLHRLAALELAQKPDVFQEDAA